MSSPGRRCDIISAARAGDYWRARNLLANSFITDWETVLPLTPEEIAGIKEAPAWPVEEPVLIEELRPTIEFVATKQAQLEMLV
jgi:hypothetical protein